MNNGYFYIRDHFSYTENDVVKMGHTINPVNRDSAYLTGEYIPGDFILLIEILNNQIYTSNKVEKIIQSEFKKYNIIYKNEKNKTGGIEFYKRDVIELVVPFLNSTSIKFKILSEDDIKELIRKEKEIQFDNNAFAMLKKIFMKKRYKLNIIRNLFQEAYVLEMIKNLEKYKVSFLKAPTGFGKTHVYYKIIQRMKFKRTLFMTPRLLLNEQLTEKKYSFYLGDEYEIYHYSNNDSSEKESLIKKISNKKKYKNVLLTCCYQSQKKFIELLEKYNCKFDCIIFDEAHFIDNSINKETKNLIINNDFSEYKIFGSATPTETIENNANIFGKVVERVKVYELINLEILCNIETIIKKMDNRKKEYHDLKNLIVESMTKYNKKKGIIYVNDCSNAKNLFKLMKQQNKINTYIYISKDVETENSDDKDIKAFENDINPSVIICVGKIGYGYDNDYIDFICLGDERQSDIDIRQIIGRGLRWNKQTYPNKLLHLLIPLYKDEFDEYKKNEHLKKYLDYIIGECGQDIIIKDGYGIIQKKGNKKNPSNKNYEGLPIDIEILNDYSTTSFNKFTDFVKFLRSNNVYTEEKYNEFKVKQSWIPNITNLKTKYPKFCFRDIHPNSLNFYSNKKDAEESFKICCDKIANEIGREKFKRYTTSDIFNKINKNNMDKKIPNIDFDLYYPN
jgi:superfamily II DNA or RNA helicase